MSSKKETSSPARNAAKSIFGGLTSTPLANPSPKSRLSSTMLSPARVSPLKTQRYSLSETPKLDRPARASDSPLPRSSRYNSSNLTAYADGKSPGLHSRIVQYSNEARDRVPSTHQARYGSPGIFPVVHFFKKEVPVISPTPRRVTVRLASPDVHWYDAACNKRNPTDTDVRNGDRNSEGGGEPETRSVLDALREISRKRIHTEVEFESPPNGPSKRQKRVESYAMTEERAKRRREDSPKSDAATAAPVVQQPKKVCVVDILAASYTSSRMLKERIQNATKRKPEVDIEQSDDQIGAKRPSNLSNAETQTITEEPPKTVPQKSPISTPVVDKPSEEPKANGSKDDDKEDSDAEKSSIIFDEKKLEVQRKNKLAILLGAFMGEKPNLLKYPNGSEQSNDNNQNKDNKLVGILSPMNKAKHDKHVHFNLTPEVKSIDNTQPVSSSENVPKDDTSKPKESDPKEEVEKAIPKPMPELKFNFGTSATLSTTTTTTSILTSPIVTTMVMTSTEKPKQEANPISNLSFSFGQPPQPKGLEETPKKAITTAASQPTGGFKFNLSPGGAKPVTNGSPAPSFNFGGIANAPTTSVPTTTSNMTPTKSLVSTFNANATSQLEAAPSLSFGTTTNATPLSSTFGMVSAPSNSSFNMSNSTAVTQSAVTGFGTVVSKSSADSNVKTSAVQPILQLGGASVAQSTVAAALPFGGSTTTAGSMMFNSGSTSGFGSNGNQQGLTGNSVSSTIGGFGTTGSSGIGISGNATTTSAFSLTTPTPAFGLPTSTTTNFPINQTTPAFGTNTATAPVPSFSLKTTPAFGTTTITSSAFPTTNPTPAFGSAVTSAPTFGIATPAFGSTPSTKAPESGFGFGAPNNFGSPGFGNSGFGAPVTTNSGFGGFGRTENTAPKTGFGTPNTTSALPAFGTNVFGTTTTASSGFGTPGFGSTVTQPNTVFGNSGANSNNAFGVKTTASSVFGNPNTTNTGFGSGSSSGFGNQSFYGKTTTAAFAATTTATPAFASSNQGNKPFSFSSGNNNNNTGNNNPGFSNSTFNFGPSNTNFGENKSTGFGTPFQPNGFQTTTTNANPTSSIFGASTGFGNPTGFGASNFGGGNTSTFGAANTTNFGSTSTSNTNAFSAPTKPQGFGFGTAEPSTSAFPKPASGAFGASGSSQTTGFQFGSGSAAPPAAAAAPPAFGAGNPSSNPPTGAAGQVFSFGGANPAASPATGGGVFAFGTPESKPGFSGTGGGAPPTFGTPTPAFGASPAPGGFGTPQFNAPAGGGMFSIGSGSSTGTRARHQLKAKRRT